MQTSSLFVVQELVELVLADLKGKQDTGMHGEPQLTCLEVGCGSGAITLSLLKDLPQVSLCVCVCVCACGCVCMCQHSCSIMSSKMQFSNFVSCTVH